MRKIGRGTSYRAALADNLVKSLLTYKKIQTTRTRGKQLVEYVRKELKKNVTIQRAPARRGDNSPQVTLEINELEKEKHHVADQHQTKSNTKNVASR
ncbi:MAG: hypothetical protein NUV98_01845 [Candidatus Roizmanbacteria bacterium]|nr:hypothetical protein [Candidatus Roizmanbacteria bacterium]